jgi:gas vesicle protein
MSTTSKWVAGLVIGLFVGAVAALLLAPSSGEETREGLLKKIDLLKEKIADLIEKGGEYTSEKVDILKNKITSLEREVAEKKAINEL